MTCDQHAVPEPACVACIASQLQARNPPQPCDVCGLAGARGKPHGIGGHMDDDETWPWCPGGKPPRAE